MSVRIDTTLQTYLAAVTIPGDFSGLPDGDFEVALGSYATPGTFQAPDAVSINSTVSVTLTGRLGAGKSFDPTAATYWLWGRATRSPDETLTRGPTMITVVTTGGTPVGPAIRYVPQQATAPDHTVYEGWLDSSTVPPTLKGWNGTSWVAIGGAGSGGVTSFQTRTGAVTLTKADVTGTGLAAADVGADASGAAATAQTAAIAAAATDATSKVAAEATARTSAIATQHTADVAAFQPIDADLTTIAALDATTAGALATDGAGWIRKTYAQLKTALALVKADVGLGSVDNTADASKPVSTAQAAADAAVQAFAIQRANHTGTQSADTLTDGTTNKAFLATERTKLAAITGTNTGDQTITLTGDATGSGTGSFAVSVVKVNGTSLAGLATGLLKNTTTTGVPSIAVAADIPNIAESQVTNLTTDLAAKAPLASPTFTGTPAAPTPSAADNSTKLATTAYVDAADNLKAPLASPTFTGTPAGPTAAVATNTTQLATTAFVIANAAGGVGGRWGDGSDGTVTLSVNTSLARDMYYDNLTVNAGVTLTTNGWRVYVRNTLTITATGFLGAPGNTSSNSSWGGGAAGSTNALKGGSNGGDASITGAGSVGGNGTNTLVSSPGGAGGAGSSGAGGTGGTGATMSASAITPKSPMAAFDMLFVNFAGVVIVGQGGGGGGGGGDGTNRGGGGGGSAGVVLVNARIIVNNGTITAKGGNGFPGAAGNAGGGGGGAGGTVFVNTTSSTGSGTVTAAGGTGGAGVGTGATGTAGTTGTTQLIVWTV